MFSHWAACRALLQVGRRSSITRAAASEKVGMDGALFRPAWRASRFSATGSRPWEIAVRLSWTISRTSARVTAGYDPSPMSRRRPWITILWTHDLLPERGYVEVESVAGAVPAGFAEGLCGKCVKLAHGSSIPIYIPTQRVGCSGIVREFGGTVKAWLSPIQLRNQVV